MLSNLTIKTKLTLLSSIGLLLLGIVITIVSVKESTSALLESEFNKLTTVQVTKTNEITNYFKSLEGLLLSVAGSKMTKDAFDEFETSFYKLDQEIPLELDFVKKKIFDDFETNFLSSVNYSVPNSPKKKATESYLPTDPNALKAQYIFITDNKEKLGEKNKLIFNETYPSSYMETHKKYHPSFDKILTQFELYDIFMVDLKGNMIYTDFKEKDYATNLKNGIYAQSGIAKVYKKALELEDGKLAFEDFAPYEPSYNASASFIATPIFINNIKRGVFIFQMPVDRINSIMSFNKQYKASGLGDSGEVYLVGSDYTMRNNSRFIKDINNKVVQDLGSTIGVWKIKTASTLNVFEHKKSQGRGIISDYRGINVLSVYSKMNLFNQASWVMVAEIDEDEALAPSVVLKNEIILLSTIIIILVAIGLLFFINKIVIKPLNVFQQGLLGFFKYLNKDSDSVNYLVVKGNDEISTMSKAVNSNIETIQKGIEEEQELILNASSVINSVNSGDLTNRIEKNSSNEGLNELKELINLMLENLEKNISSILQVLGEYSNYNYLNRVDKGQLQGEISQLMEGINILGDSITKMLVQNKKTGSVLQTGANSLMSNVDTLSTCSNEAAASLEQTAAALEEITGIVTNNTEKIHQMRNYATELNEAVENGNDLANQTTESMDEISEQVNAMNDAITVIDQITFQTNILSLNAAVEAATAGEAGRGFSVVAQEVRNLAGRSAESAKEIKSLVEIATMKANEGKRIALNMKEGYGSLNENIEKTTDLINEVADASKEQKYGVEQINDAINQLDQQTQQNAATANHTKDISVQTNNIAREIVEETNQKQFNEF